MEAYVFGLLTPSEKQAFEQVLATAPELQQALAVVEQRVEQYAINQAVPPPPDIRQQFDDFMKGLSNP